MDNYIGFCEDCENAYEDEDLSGNWRWYCIKKIDNKDGSEVAFYDCCEYFKERKYKINENIL